ncbi:unnamed protein product [marine sediment metagenome]|uniref:Uncharacterized protein n=1 Tax=marine sediment metagenome TaxID=412755 RepID=X1EW71_9ZZZZ
MEKKRLIKKFKDKLRPLQKKEIINVFFLISYIVTIFFLIYFIMQTALQTQFPVGIALIFVAFLFIIAFSNAAGISISQFISLPKEIDKFS